MKAVQIFSNPEFGEVRTINENGAVLFCGSDVARALGYARPNEAIASHTKGTVKRSAPTNGMRTLSPVLRDDYEEVTA